MAGPLVDLRVRRDQPGEQLRGQRIRFLCGDHDRPRVGHSLDRGALGVDPAQRCLAGSRVRLPELVGRGDLGAHPLERAQRLRAPLIHENTACPVHPLPQRSHLVRAVVQVLVADQGPQFLNGAPPVLAHAIPVCGQGVGRAHGVLNGGHVAREELLERLQEVGTDLHHVVENRLNTGRQVRLRAQRPGANRLQRGLRLVDLPAEVERRTTRPVQDRAPPLHSVVDGDGPHASAVPGILALGGVSPGPEAEILTIGVAESWRGRGLGGRLLDELVSAAVREGAETVFLEVRSRSEGARALYEGRGFVPVGLRRRYYRDDDALVMRRDVRR